MKILTASQIRDIDAYTIAHEPVTSANLMERASAAFVQWFTRRYAPPQRVSVVCGTGNNGGDGLCVARLLHQRHYDVLVLIVQDNSAIHSRDFQHNRQRLNRFPAIIMRQLSETNPLQSYITGVPIIIDALLGSGLNRPLSGIYAQTVAAINQTKCVVVAIDTPSGLYADRHTDGIAVEATHTVAFQLPKLAFMLPENYRYVGDWHVIPIQLHPIAIDQATTNYYYLDDLDCFLLEEASPLPTKNSSTKFAHKGTRGHVLVIGGSKGKIGAAILATRAALYAGAGLTTTYVPACGYHILQTVAPEAMALTDENDTHITQLPADLSPYRAIAIGVGLGQHTDTAQAVCQLLQTATCPLVIDADALNIIADKQWQHLIPPNSILTPHLKEFERLAGKTANDFERLDRLRQVALQWHCYIALKGAHTAIACPNGQVIFNSTGNPAMATGGSGDVLTGIISAYLAQGYSPQQALLTGVYRHGQAGDRTVQQSRNGNITALDLLNNRL